MRENCTSSLCGGRRSAREQSSAPPPTRQLGSRRTTWRPAAEQSAAESAAAESMERRAGTEGNADRQSTHWTQSQARVSQALDRIRQLLAVWTRGGRSYGAAAAEVMGPSSSLGADGGCPVTQVNDLSRSLAAFDPISTLMVVVEMSKASWLVSGVVPGVERQPLKKLEPDA